MELELVFCHCLSSILDPIFCPDTQQHDMQFVVMVKINLVVWLRLGEIAAHYKWMSTPLGHTINLVVAFLVIRISV